MIATHKPNLSLCQHHFAQVRLVKSSRRLWNVYINKDYADRPEERVRLQAADALVLGDHFPASRLSFEAGLSKTMKRGTLRTDLVVYSTNMKPFLLVECKQPDVKLNEETMRQALIYNEVLKAPHVWLTNGFQDVFFTDGNVTPHPTWLNPSSTIDRSVSYWAKRGFLPHGGSAFQLEILNNWFNPAQIVPFTVFAPAANATFQHYARKSSVGPVDCFNTFWSLEDEFLTWQLYIIKERMLVGRLTAKVGVRGDLTEAVYTTISGTREVDFANLINVTPQSLLSFNDMELVQSLTSKLRAL